MKRFFLTIFLSFSLALLLSRPALAQGQPIWMMGDGFDDAIQEGVTGGSNAESFTMFQSINALPNSMSMALMGISSDTITKVLQGQVTPEDEIFYKRMRERSLAGGVSRGIAMVYANPPASFGPWLADVGHTLGFIPDTVYAQGIGFSGLAPLLPIWKAFRNVAYLILAVVMIVIGFMVMLRKKIDPKTVVSVQNALPRIVVTLILITFSYAIVGFLIDLMYLLILLAVTVIGSTMKNGSSIQELQAAFTAGGFMPVWKIFDPLNPLVTGWESLTVSALPGFAALIAFLIGGPPVALFAILFALAFGAGAGVGLQGSWTLGLLSPIIVLLLSIGLIITLIRILFMVVNAYIQIIVALLFGPLQLLLEAIPGTNGFASWLNNLIVNLLTFPLVAILILIGTSIVSNIEQDRFWTPPLVPVGTAPFIKALLGLGIIMTIPTIVNGIKESLKIKPALPLTAGAVTAPIGAAGGVAMQGLSQIYYVQMLTGQGGFLNKAWTAIRGGK